MREKVVEQKLFRGEALSTASGRNFGRAEVNRNKRAPQWGAAPIEVAEVRCKREKEVERKLVQTVRKHGGLALKFVSPGLNGVPDRLLLFPGGKMAFAEVKAPGKKPRPLQEVRIAQLRGLGFRVYVVDDVEQIGGMIDEICSA